LLVTHEELGKVYHAKGEINDCQYV
jgi:hypothetical protein